MAKPDGAIDISDGGLDIPQGGRDTYTTFAVSALCPIQPPHWSVSDTELSRQFMTVSGQYTLNAAYAITTEAMESWLSLAGIDTFTPGATINAAWQTAWSAHPNVYQDTPGSYSDPAPAYVNLYFRVSGPASMTGVNEIVALNIEMTNWSSYTTPEPLSADNLEQVGRGAWQLHDNNRSCSAYFMQRVASGNSNRIAYQARSTWTVPL